MGQKKLIRFEALKSFQNVFQYTEEQKGNWSLFFKNNHLITLELACGKGDYSRALAAINPNRNFIGVDIKGNRLFIGAQDALRNKQENIAFLRIQIQKIEAYFSRNEVAEIWITFPDPFLRASKAKNRLTHPRFLSYYQKILSPNGFIHLKTDSKELYEFTLESLLETNCTIHENWADIYATGKAIGDLAIQTFYEKMHLADGRKIYYLKFSLPEKTIILPPKTTKNEAELGG